MSKFFEPKLSPEVLSSWYQNVEFDMLSVVLLHSNGNIGIPFSSLKSHFKPAYPEGEKKYEGLQFNDFLKKLETKRKRSKENGSKRRRLDAEDKLKCKNEEENFCSEEEDDLSFDRPSEPDSPNKICFVDPEIKEAVERLNDCLQDRNLESWSRIRQKKDLTEQEQIVAIGVHLVKKLTGGAYTKDGVAETDCPCGCDEQLHVANMCIGLADTWHGELDILSGNKTTNIAVVESEPADSTNSTDEDKSEGSEVEKEPITSGQNLCQYFGESIVFSFMEYNRNPDFGLLVPTILILKESFTVFIYDSINDEMYVPLGYIDLLPECNPKNLIVKDFVGIFLLWICLNHHLFFRKELTNRSCCTTGFVESLDPASKEKYRSLRAFSRRVDVGRFKQLVLHKSLLKLLRAREAS